jgi:hypothetical protein
MGAKLGLTIREEHSLSVSVFSVVRKIFGPKRDEVTVGCRSYIMRNFATCTGSLSIIKMNSRRMRTEK